MSIFIQNYQVLTLYGKAELYRWQQFSNCALSMSVLVFYKPRNEIT